MFDSGATPTISRRKMTEYMKQGSDTTSPNPTDGTPFDSLITKLQGYNDKDRVKEVLKESERIYKKLERDGTIRTEKAITDNIGYPEGNLSADRFYWFLVGPQAAQAECVRWNRVYRFNPEAYPETEQDRTEALSELNIPDGSLHKQVPQFIKGNLNKLRKTYEKDNRGLHPQELCTLGAVVCDPYRGVGARSLTYFEKVPWVESPDTDKPAWEWLEE